EFDGVYQLPRTRELYEQIATAELTDSNGSSLPDIGCYYSPDGERRVYFLENHEVSFPNVLITDWARAEVSFAGAEVELFDDSGLPPWFDEREACLDGDFSGDLDFLSTPVTDIPTAGDVGLLALIGLLTAAALRQLRG
ncbi:MAG: hypothetical protein AAGM22_31250, partial [Acidobacteriota bacterium]